MEKILNLLSTPAFAQNTQTSGQIMVRPQGNATGLQGLATITFPNLLSSAISVTLILAALIAFFFLVFGGIKWITSGGDKDATAKAQGTITAALIGLAIVFSAWAILKIIEAVFGVQILGGFTLPNAQNPI